MAVRMSPNVTFTGEDVDAVFEAPGTCSIHVDVNRTDSYVANGTIARPYKYVADAITVANALATSAHPYLVNIGPGIYDLVPAFTVASYVRVLGAGWSQTILKCADLTDHFITLMPSSGIRDVGIYGPTTAFKSCIHIPTTDPKAVSVTEVQFHQGYYGILADPPGAASTLIRNCTYGYKVGSTINTLIRLEGGTVAILNSVTATGPDESLQTGISAVGAAVVCTLTGLYHTCFGAATTGVEIDDGAAVRLISSVFAGGHTAVRLGSTGAPKLRADGNLIHRAFGVGANYTYDINIQGAAGSVVFSSGFASRDRINNPFNAEIFAQFVNHESTNEGGCVLGEFYVGEHADTPFPMLRYAKDTSLTGLVSGGEVTRNAGLVLDVAAGEGYVNDGSHPTRFTWLPTSVTLGANKPREYVFVNSSGLVTHSDTKPDYSTNIVLARAVTGAATVDLLTQDEVSVVQSLSRQADYLEHTVGPLMESGCSTVLGGSGGLKLKVVSGVFWVGLSERAVDGADDITFTAWYRSGSNWVAVPSQTTIDVTQWDNGSGTLQALTGGKYTNATLYIAVNADGDEYHVVYGQEEFNNQGDAEAGGLPVPPNVLKEYCCRSAAIIVLQGAAVIASFVDVRPQIGQFAVASSGITGDHDLLSNLGNDSHLQYLNTGRALTWHGTLPGAHVTNGDTHAHSAGDGAQIDHDDLANHGTTSHADIDSHIGNTSNPHAVTAAQAGAVPTGDTTAIPTANKVPIADASALLDGWVSSGAAAVTPSLRAIGTGALEACAGNDARLTDARTPSSTLAHKASHTTGADILDTAVAGVSPGLLSASDKTKLDGITSDAVAATASLRTLGTTATSACAGNDARLSDARTPSSTLAHKASHISGADQLDDATALAHGLMTAAQFTKLAGIVYGDGYQTAISLARSTPYNTNTQFQTKVTLTTPALPAGTYRVGWTAVLDSSATNQNVEAQLYNVTDAAIVGTVQIMRATNAAERRVVSGFAEVVFAGVSKAFAIQYRTANTGASVAIADARIDIWRVS